MSPADCIQTDPSHLRSQDAQSAPAGLQAVGPALRIFQLNAEGPSKAKRTLIGKLAYQHSADVICLEETHIAVNEAARFTTNGYDLLSHTLEAKHGRATYVKSDIADAHCISSSEFCDVIEVGGYQIANVYKPPSGNWQNPLLPILDHPGIYTGDFNSHHQDWGYDDSSKDGEELANWACRNDVSLIHDRKQCGTFHSARWKKDYSPDLCWVTTVNAHSQQVSSTVFGDFPHSQYRPTLIHVGLQLPVVHSSNKLRWNFRKANWFLYSDLAYRSIPTILVWYTPVEEYYKRFCQAIFKAASKSVPRGRRPIYIPCLDAECEKLLKQYEESNDPDVADHLLESLDAARLSRWEEITSSLDFTHSSRKAWNTIRRLGASQQPNTPSWPSVTPNQVAHHLIKLGQAKSDGHWEKGIRDEWRQHLLRNSTMPKPDTISVKELNTALENTKSGTAAGYSDIAPEFLKHLGPLARCWLSKFLSHILKVQRTPRLWRRSKVIAILIPGKDPKAAASYRPISLLSVCFKLSSDVYLHTQRSSCQWTRQALDQVDPRVNRCWLCPLLLRTVSSKTSKLVLSLSI